MRRVREGTVGILPPGALGVAFFYHLTRELRENDGRVFFLARSGSRSAESLRAMGDLVIRTAGGLKHVPFGVASRGDLGQAFETEQLPEVLLVCTNPDQLGGVLDEVVRLLERSYERDELTPDELNVPITVLSANGIYFQRQRQAFIERLEESTLLGRLPDLWPDLMPRIVGRLVRGVTIQTGLRDGSGANTVYEPGPRGITRLAAGDEAVRRRAHELLQGRGGWFELARHSSATRLEFDKAMVNLTSNLLGQLYAIDARGHFSPLRVSQIVTTEHEPAMRELTRHVLATGRAVRAYSPDENFEEIFQHMLQTNHQHDDHIPSSLQWVGLRLRQKKLEPVLTPTEAWLLEPLIRYAHAAGLDDSAAYFEALRGQLLAKLKLAAARVS